MQTGRVVECGGRVCPGVVRERDAAEGDLEVIEDPCRGLCALIGLRQFRETSRKQS